MTIRDVLRLAAFLTSVFLIALSGSAGVWVIILGKDTTGEIHAYQVFIVLTAVLVLWLFDNLKSDWKALTAEGAEE